MRLARLLLLVAVGCGSSSSTPDARATAPWVVSASFVYTLADVWATGSDVFLIDANAAAYHSSDGIAFPAVPLDASIKRGTRIWGTSATDVYAMGYGDDGGMDHSADLGASWQPITIPTTLKLLSMSGTVGDLYVVAQQHDGSDSVLHSADGVMWQSQTVPIKSLFGLWASANDIYAVGDGGIAHSTGNGVWTAQDTSHPDLRSVWGSSASDVYAVGQPAVRSGVFHSDGAGTWTEQSGCTGMMYAVWGTSPSDVWTVGEAGTICHSTGDGTWSMVDSGTQLDLYGIAATDTAMYAVGGELGGDGPGILLRSP